MSRLAPFRLISRTQYNTITSLLYCKLLGRVYTLFNCTISRPTQWQYGTRLDNGCTVCLFTSRLFALDCVFNRLVATSSHSELYGLTTLRQRVWNWKTGKWTSKLVTIRPKLKMATEAILNSEMRRKKIVADVEGGDLPLNVQWPSWIWI